MVFLEEFFGQIFSFNKAICSLAMEPQCSSQYTVEARTDSILASKQNYLIKSLPKNYRYIISFTFSRPILHNCRENELIFGLKRMNCDVVSH